MGLALIRGPQPALSDFCHVCVMMYKSDMLHNQELVTAINNALEKDSANYTIIKAEIRQHWEPELSVTIGPSIYGTFGSVCWTHVAHHDEEEYQKRRKAAQKAAAAIRLGIDPETVADKPKLVTE